jgi:hypothetical protein
MNFGGAASVVPSFALEAQMTLNPNHREQPVQKAGQKAGAALPPSPNTSQVSSHGADRAAGGETLSQKTSTAALDSFRRGPLLLQRRPPRHGLFVGSAFRGGPFNSTAVCYANVLDHHKSNLNAQEKTMNATTQRKSLTILSLIICSLFFTVTASAADLRVSQIQPQENRFVLNFPVDRAKALELQSWVNAGHDSWCRDSQLVAASALARISTRFSEFEPASLQLETSEKTKAVYTFHSLDGHTNYRITLRRYRFLLPTAGSLRDVIWIPETAEIISHNTRD